MLKQNRRRSQTHIRHSGAVDHAWFWGTTSSTRCLQHSVDFPRFYLSSFALPPFHLQFFFCISAGYIAWSHKFESSKLWKFVGPSLLSTTQMKPVYICAPPTSSFSCSKHTP